MSDLERLMNDAMRAAPTPRQVEMRRVGNAIRKITDKLVATEAPIDELAELAGRLEGLVAVLEPWPQGHAYDAFAEAAIAGSPVGFLDNSPIQGEANPLAPPLRMTVADGRVVGDVRFGSAYEGPPGCVHGGWVAAAYDELLGTAQTLTGLRGMTGYLTVRYRRPTPLHTDLRMEGELVRVDGRKILTIGRCFVGDEVVSEAEALFISVDFTKIAELYAGRLGGEAQHSPRGLGED